MAPLRVSTTKSEWLPDDPTAFVPTRLWKLPFITTWDDSRNQNHPTDSAEEANLVKARVQTHTLADDGNQHVNRDRDPDLGLHGVLGGAEESFDPQMLLDPFEEQFHLPPRLVDQGDGKCRQREVVGEKLESLPCVHVEITHSSQLVWVGFDGVDGGQNDSVIGSNAGGLVHRMRVSALDQDIGLGAHNEEGRAKREDVKTLEIHVAAIHDVEGSSLRRNLVEDVDVMHFAVGNADKRGDIAMQVQQCVHLHRAFVAAKLRPGKQRQAKIDGGGIQCVQAVVKIHADGIGGVEGPCDADQDLREVGKDAPVTRLVGVGQSGARHLALEAHVVQLRTHCTEACFYVPQALPISELSEGHGQILVPAREVSQAGVAIVTRDAATKLSIRQEGDQLREDGAALVHEPLSAGVKRTLGACCRSNRGKAQIAANR